MNLKCWKLGIIGWPLGYSLSPRMQEAALKAAGLRGEYREIKVKPEELDAWLDAEAAKLDGFNVTMPHKTAAAAWCRASGGSLDPVAAEMEAVNTVAFSGGKPVGHNTDGAGFLASLEVRRLDPKGWEVGLVGAGGAAKAIALALARRGVSRVHVWNRNAERAKELAERVNKASAKPVASVTEKIDAFPVHACRMLVNATPTGMHKHEEFPVEIGRLRKGQVVYDIVYEPRETRLISEAREQGCEVITGDEMLAGQGAAAFEIWTKVPAAKVLPAMRKMLEKHFAEREKAGKA
ncbi:MAG: shikimate dehydrogenase [Candidatus Omnitrophica bacterium]|nr:shikimate dehydrogenase [Candidatus Omnitrophota bacterium]